MEKPDGVNGESCPILEKSTTSHSSSGNCALCGCSTPAVRCDKCGSQIFCLSCDDMYHKHPKRRFHLRKAVDSIWNSHRSPRLRRRTELPGDPAKIPIPPPRTKKRERHTISGIRLPGSGFEIPTFGFKSAWVDAKHTGKPQGIKTDLQSKQQSPTAAESNYENTDSVSEWSNLPNSTVNGIQSHKNEDLIDSNEENCGNIKAGYQGANNDASPIHISVPADATVQSGVTHERFECAPQFQAYGMPHSLSTADLTAAQQTGPPVYHLPQVHPFMHPHIHPYSHPMAHLNCPQCLSASWSNLMSSHMPPYQHQLWASPNANISKGLRTPSPDVFLKHSQGSVHDPMSNPATFSYKGNLFYPFVPPTAEPPSATHFHEQGDVQRQRKSSSASSSMHSHNRDDKKEEVLQILSSDEELDNDPTVNPDEVDVTPKIPEKPSVSWSCVHCTFINPPGSLICQVCCKTSYGTDSTRKSSTKCKKDKFKRARQDSESSVDLVNMDAFQAPLDATEEFTVIDSELETTTTHPEQHKHDIA